MAIKRKDFKKTAAFINEFLLKLSVDVECAEVRDALNMALLQMQRYYRRLQMRTNAYSTRTAASLNDTTALLTARSLLLSGTSGGETARDLGFETTRSVEAGEARRQMSANGLGNTSGFTTSRGVSPMTPFRDAPDRFTWKWVDLEAGRAATTSRRTRTERFDVGASDLRHASRTNSLPNTGDAMHDGEASNDATNSYQHATNRAEMPTVPLAHKLVQLGDLQQLVSLVKKDPNVLNSCDALGRTPLMYAAHFDQPECASFLVEHGADVNARCNEEASALHYACAASCARMTDCLVQRCAAANAEDVYGRTALHWAAVADNCDCLQNLLKHDVDLAVRDREGLSALMWACRVDNVDHFNLLEQALRRQLARSGKADESEVIELDRDLMGRTCLHWAVRRAEPMRLLRSLLERRTCSGVHDDEEKTVLLHAAESGSLAACKLILEVVGDSCLLDSDKHKRTALHYAVLGGHGDVANLLLEHGADIDTPDIYNTSAAVYAQSRQLNYNVLIINAHRRKRERQASQRDGAPLDKDQLAPDSQEAPHHTSTQLYKLSDDDNDAAVPNFANKTDHEEMFTARRDSDAEQSPLHDSIKPLPPRTPRSSRHRSPSRKTSRLHSNQSQSSAGSAMYANDLDDEVGEREADLPSNRPSAPPPPRPPESLSPQSVEEHEAPESHLHNQDPHKFAPQNDSDSHSQVPKSSSSDSNAHVPAERSSSLLLDNEFGPARLAELHNEEPPLSLFTPPMRNRLEPIAALPPAEENGLLSPVAQPRKSKKRAANPSAPPAADGQNAEAPRGVKAKSDLVVSEVETERTVSPMPMQQRLQPLGSAVQVPSSQSNHVSVPSTSSAFAAHDVELSRPSSARKKNKSDGALVPFNANNADDQQNMETVDLSEYSRENMMFPGGVPPMFMPPPPGMMFPGARMPMQGSNGDGPAMFPPNMPFPFPMPMYGMGMPPPRMGMPPMQSGRFPMPGAFLNRFPPPPGYFGPPEMFMGGPGMVGPGMAGPGMRGMPGMRDDSAPFSQDVLILDGNSPVEFHKRAGSSGGARPASNQSPMHAADGKRRSRTADGLAPGAQARPQHSGLNSPPQAPSDPTAVETLFMVDKGGELKRPNGQVENSLAFLPMGRQASAIPGQQAPSPAPSARSSRGNNSSSLFEMSMNYNNRKQAAEAQAQASASSSNSPQQPHASAPGRPPHENNYFKAGPSNSAQPPNHQRSQSVNAVDRQRPLQTVSPGQKRSGAANSRL